MGDIRIDIHGDEVPEAGPARWVFIDELGRISCYYANGYFPTLGQILLRDCAHPELLIKTNYGLYALLPTAGPWTALGAPKSGDLGWLLPGSVELSEFDQSILDVRSRLNFFLQNTIVQSSNTTDLAIGGGGFFTLRDPVANVFYATRWGAFHLDAAGRLVNTNGFRVQGFADAGLSTTGDIVIDSAGAPPISAQGSTMVQFTIDIVGRIGVLLNDGTEFIRGQILLQDYRDPQALVPGPSQLYSNVTEAQPLYSMGLPGCGGLGCIWCQALEIPYVQPVLRLRPQSGMRLQVTQLPWDAAVESSSDLVSWTDLAPVPTSQMQEAEIFLTNSPPSRFYRIRLPLPVITPPAGSGHPTSL